jgi:hypothetical protein
VGACYPNCVRKAKSSPPSRRCCPGGTSGSDVADGVPAVPARGRRHQRPRTPKIAYENALPEMPFPKWKRRQGRSCDRPLSGRDKGLPDASRGPSKRACTPASDTTDASAPAEPPAASWQPKPGHSSGGPASHVRPGPGPPDPTAFHRRGSRRPRAALRNPVPGTSDPCPHARLSNLTRALREPRSSGACATLPASSLAADPPAAGTWASGPAPPSPPDLPAPCGTLAAPTVGPIPARVRGSVDAVPPSLPGRPQKDARAGLDGSGVAAFRPACAGLPATAPEVRRRPVRPAPPAFRRRLLPVDRAPAKGTSGMDRSGLATSSLSLTGMKGLRPAHCRQRESAAARQNLVDRIRA